MSQSQSETSRQELGKPPRNRHGTPKTQRTQRTRGRTLDDIVSTDIEEGGSDSLRSSGGSGGSGGAGGPEGSGGSVGPDGAGASGGPECPEGSGGS